MTEEATAVSRETNDEETPRSVLVRERVNKALTGIESLIAVDKEVRADRMRTLLESDSLHSLFTEARFAYNLYRTEYEDTRMLWDEIAILATQQIEAYQVQVEDAMREQNKKLYNRMKAAEENYMMVDAAVKSLLHTLRKFDPDKKSTVYAPGFFVQEKDNWSLKDGKEEAAVKFCIEKGALGALSVDPKKLLGLAEAFPEVKEMVQNVPRVTPVCKKA